MREPSSRAVVDLPQTTRAEVAFLATGTELIHGDILNTNSPAMARRLREHGMEPGQQYVVSDNQADIASGLQLLLSHHRVVVTLGGLGPTEDDRTRFAIADALGRPMVYDEASWHWIQKRLNDHGYTTHPTNQRQAYFPEGAEIIPNPRGTAHAARIRLGEQCIYMLPGPPCECMPLFEHYCLPDFARMALQQPRHFKHWFLMRASESEIAGKIADLKLDPTTTDAAFRAAYPYLEVKLTCTDNEALRYAIQCIQPIVQPYALTQPHKASQLLIAWAKSQQTTIAIDDQVTKGLLESTLREPGDGNPWCFTPMEDRFEDAQHRFCLQGMQAYWEGRQPEVDTLHIQDLMAPMTTHTIPVRCNRGDPRPAMVEWISAYLLDTLAPST